MGLFKHREEEKARQERGTHVFPKASTKEDEHRDSILDSTLPTDPPQAHDRETLALGKKARDTVSGWTGILFGRFEYMNGCVRWEIAYKNKDGEPTSYVFDEQQIEVVFSPSEPDKKNTFVPPPPAHVGGPRSSTPPAR